MKKNTLIRIIIILVLGLGIAAIIAALQIQNDKENGLMLVKANKNSAVQENFGGPFTLVNHMGEDVTQADFDNTKRLIYFGFTYCPAICPTELQKITAALNMVGEKADDITPIFITVDPERDTVEVMNKYLESFHPKFVGLTGTNDQVDQAKDSYKIYAAKVQDDSMSDYTMDHSSFIYYLDENNTLLRIFKMEDSAEVIADFIRHHK